MLSFYKIVKMDTITVRVTVSNVSISYCVPDDDFVFFAKRIPFRDKLRFCNAIIVCVYICVGERDKFTPEIIITHLKGGEILWVFSPYSFYMDPSPFDIKLQ